MTSYRAPIKDMLFTFNDILNFGDISTLEKYADATPDLLEAILEEAGKYTSDVIAPLNYPGDVEGAHWSPDGVTLPKGYNEAYKGLVEAGWISLLGDPEYGGQGLPQSAFSAIQEMLCAASLAFAQSPALTIGAYEAIEAHGSDELKSKFLPKMISGEWQGTMNLTEPQAGSDVGALRTKAIPQDDGTYLIKGQKIFITCGEHDMTENIIHLVLARIEGAPQGSAGISLFLVPKFFVDKDGALQDRNDVVCTSIEHKMGLRGSPACVMAYGDNDSCKGYLIGQENRGLQCMFTMMNAARLCVGLQGIGVAERAYQQAVQYASERVQGIPIGSPRNDSAAIIEHADVRRMLMTMKAKVASSRAIAYWNAIAMDMADAHPDTDTRKYYSTLADLLTPLTKAYGSDVGVEVSSDAVQVHGGMGFIEETGIAQIYRDARIVPIYEGTNGIQAWDLANRKLKMDGGRHWQEFLNQIEDFANTQLDDKRFGDIQSNLLDAVRACRRVGEWFLHQHADNPRDVAAGSVPFLRMFAETVGAYLLTKGAASAVRRLDQGDTDSEFLHAQITTARFMAERLLPLSSAQLAPIQTGDQLLFAITPEQLGAI